VQPDDDRFLLEGPHSRTKELRLVLQVAREFIVGFRTLHFVGPCVTVFGSARFAASHPYYALGREVGRGLVQLGFTVMTGGGPGLMEAANRGAREAGGISVGCNIESPAEQHPNPFLDRWVVCHHFFVRKVLLFKYSYAFVALPGGLGTLDELTEALTLVQTGKIRNFPVVLIGTEYWRPFQTLLREMVVAGTIAQRDLDMALVTDDVNEAMAHIERYAVQAFGLRRRALTPSPILGESRVRSAMRSTRGPSPRRAAALPRVPGKEPLMSRILVLYGTSEGHTAKVANRLADTLRAQGGEVDVVDASMSAPDPAGYAGVLVAASVHGGRYQKSVQRWVRTFAPELRDKPTAFMSVCLGILQHEEKVQHEVAAIIERFVNATGWTPSMTTTVAGALPYTRYNWITRWIMRRIARAAGGDTDVSRDYEYTDWEQVESFARAFSERVNESQRRTPAA
jgi:uncharacterized protein (TIGR00730 family)